MFRCLQVRFSRTHAHRHAYKHAHRTTNLIQTRINRVFKLWSQVVASVQ